MLLWCRFVTAWWSQLFPSAVHLDPGLHAAFQEDGQTRASGPGCIYAQDLIAQLFVRHSQFWVRIGQSVPGAYRSFF